MAAAYPITLIATTPDGTVLTDQAYEFTIEVLDPCEPPTVQLSAPTVSDVTYYLQDGDISIEMDAFTVENKAQSYCFFDHVIDIPGALSAAMTTTRSGALADTG